MKKIFSISIYLLTLLAIFNIIEVLYTQCENNLYVNCSLSSKSTIGYSVIALFTFLVTLYVISRYQNIQRIWLLTAIPFMTVSIIVIDKLTVLPLQSNRYKFDSFVIENAAPMLFLTYFVCLLYLVHILKRISIDKDKIFTSAFEVSFLAVFSLLLIWLNFFYGLIPAEIRSLAGFRDHFSLFSHSFYILPFAFISGVLVKLIRPYRFLLWLHYMLFFVPAVVVSSIYFYASSSRYSGGWLSLNELIYTLPVYGSVLLLVIFTFLVLVWKKSKKLNAKSK